MFEREILLDHAAVNAAIARLADEVVGEFCGCCKEKFALLGIHRQGVPLASRLARMVAERCGYAPEVGMLDISMYRDDIGMRKTLPKINVTDIPFDVNDNNIVLVDDIFSSGRTIRAALDAITDYGRPRTIRLAVLVDRHASEFPIHPDFTGVDMSVPEDFKLIAEFTPDDAADAVYQVRWQFDKKQG